MTAHVVMLSAAYAALAALLLVLCLRTRLPPAVKAGAVVVVSAFYVVTYFAFHGITGWAAERALPERFRLVAAVVDEPKSIYLWVLPLDDSTTEPRSYRIPYESQLHAEVDTAVQRMHRGQAQLGQRRPSSGSRAARGDAIRFSDVPGRRLPPKQ